MMKKMSKNKVTRTIQFAAISLATLGIFAIPARAEMSSQTVTESRTVTGTVNAVTPSSTIVVTAADGTPTTYTINKRTVFVDQAGNVVSYNQLQGEPVKVYVTEEQQQPVVERVVVTKPVTRVIEQPAPQVMHHEETRTTTTKSQD